LPTHPLRPEIHLLDGRFYARDPHPHFEWLRENAPLYHDPNSGCWAVSRYDDIQAFSRDPRTFSSAGGSRPDSPPIPSMINFDDPYHKRRRNLVNKGFTKRRVESHEPAIRRICRGLIDAVIEKGECEFVAEIAAPLPMILIGDLLGVAPEDRDTLLRWSDDLISGLSTSASREAIGNAARAASEYMDYARRVIADRRARPPQEDLMSVLVHAEIDGERLDDEALIQESLLILVGGDETTRHVISGGMLALMRHPEQRHRLLQDPRLLPSAVEEMLRFVTPIQNMSRTATRDVEHRGQTIRAGDKLLLLYASGNRDRRVFADPHAFDVERSPNEHVAFGGYGAHFCLGASLARLELRVMFEELLARLPDLELATDEPLPMRPSNFITGIERMPVRFAPRPRSGSGGRASRPLGLFQAV
jgi:cytochrome P450 family 142 subfamily A polypeptide 1